MMKLELNLPALERLIGGDTEIEVGIRRQICEEFTKKHLKQFLNDETWSKWFAEWKTKVSTEITQRIEEAERHATTMAQNPGAYGQEYWRVGDYVKKMSENIIEKIIDEKAEQQKTTWEWMYSRKVSQLVNNEVQKLMDVAAKEAVQRHASTRLDELVEAEIQRRLTLLKEGAK